MDCVCSEEVVAIIVVAIATPQVTAELTQVTRTLVALYLAAGTHEVN
jgi:hypothetical protein